MTFPNRPRRLVRLLLFLSVAFVVITWLAGCADRLRPSESGQVPTTPAIQITPVRRSTPIPSPTPRTFTEAQLALAAIPTRDLRDLALRLRPDIEEIPLMVNATTPTYAVGDEIEFWASNVETNERFRFTARLIHKTAVAYAWVQVDQPYESERIMQAVDQFSEVIYPTVRQFFGSEWLPGVDNDPRLHILHVTNLGGPIAGYYSSADQFSRLANPYSNEKEMFYISLDWLNRTNDYVEYETVLAHEFQHMIHWHIDRDETAWVNEGLSELAQDIVGYEAANYFPSLYASQPDTQLTTWGDVVGSNGPHYGGAYLFMAYLYQRFGEAVTKAVVASPANSVRGIELALQQTGNAQSFVDLFADRTVANFVDDPDALGLPGIYGYAQMNVPQPIAVHQYGSYPVGPLQSDVRNFGVDYVQLTGGRDLVITFAGEVQTRLAPTSPHSGDRMWWSNRADHADTRLTRRFDLSALAPGTAVEMEVALWYVIEADYDYGYVLASRDGIKWQVLQGQFTTDTNPNGNSFGSAYTGDSGSDLATEAQWINDRFDLSDYAGETIWVRFEYVTDDVTNTPGWFIDDVRIAALGYAADFEAESEGWLSEGWVLTDNRLTQDWLLQLLILQNDDLLSVQTIPVDGAGQATIPVAIADRNRSAVLTISGTTPVTTEVAQYEFSIEAR